MSTVEESTVTPGEEKEAISESTQDNNKDETSQADLEDSTKDDPKEDGNRSEQPASPSLATTQEKKPQTPSRMSSRTKRKSQVFSDDEFVVAGPTTPATPSPKKRKPDQKEPKTRQAKKESNGNKAKKGKEAEVEEPVDNMVQEEEDVVCILCQRGDHPEKLLLCDGCDQGFHIYCTNPKLPRVPRGEWFCLDCKEEREKAEKEPPAKPVEKAPKQATEKAKTEKPAPEKVPEQPSAPVEKPLKAPSSPKSKKSKKNKKKEWEGAVKPSRNWLKTGSSVLVKWNDGQWYNGVIEGKAIGKDFYQVRFTDGEMHQVSKEKITMDDETLMESLLLDDPLQEEAKEEAPKEDDEPIICLICKGGHDDEKLLLCDKCDMGYHIFCLDPPLEAVPENEWYCPVCQVKIDKKKKRDEQRKKQQEAQILYDDLDTMLADGIETKKTTSRRTKRSQQAASENVDSTDFIDDQDIDDRPKVEKRKKVKREKEPKEPKEQPPTISQLLAEEEEHHSKPTPTHQVSQNDSTTTDTSPQATKKKPVLPEGNPLDTIKIERRPSSATVSTSDATTSPNTTQKSAAVATVTFWKGGLNFDGQFVCNIAAYCKADQQQQFVKSEWPKLLDGKKITILPSFPAEAPTLNLLPEKNDPAYTKFLWSLEKGLCVCAVSFPTRNLYIVPSSLMPGQKAVLGNKPSLVAVFMNKPAEANPTPQQAAESPKLVPPKSVPPKPVPPKPTPVQPAYVQPTPAVPQIPAPITFQAPGNLLASTRFMNGVKFVIIGYPAEKRVTSTIKFLVEQGGAVHKEKIDPANTDLIVINPSYMHKLVEVPELLQCKLEPHIKIIKGIEYLENCCKTRSVVVPQPAELCFKSGGIIVIGTDVLLQEDNVFSNILELLEKEKEKHPDEEWIIKLHKNTLKGVKNFVSSSEIAKKADEALEKVLDAKDSKVPVLRISDEEESKSQNSAIPSEVLRSAMKLSFVYAATKRHVILISKEKKLQVLAESQRLSCMPFEGLVHFFEDQENRRKHKAQSMLPNGSSNNTVNNNGSLPS